MKTRLGLSFWRSQNLKKKGGGKENTNRVNETLIKINLKQKRKEKKRNTHKKAKRKQKRKTELNRKTRKAWAPGLCFRAI